MIINIPLLDSKCHLNRLRLIPDRSLPLVVVKEEIIEESPLVQASPHPRQTEDQC